MATLATIQKEIAKLEKQAEALRKAEAAAAAATARELIARHHLSAADVGLADKPAKGPRSGSQGAAQPEALRRKVAVAKPAGAPKYRDPKTGKTWTGNGKRPAWIVSAKNPEKFLIDAAAAAPTPAAKTAPASPVKAAKAPAKTAVKPAAKPAAQPAPEAVAKKAATPRPAPRKRAVVTAAAEPAAPVAPAVDAPPADAAGN